MRLYIKIMVFLGLSLFACLSMAQVQLLSMERASACESGVFWSSDSAVDSPLSGEDKFFKTMQNYFGSLKNGDLTLHLGLMSTDGTRQDAAKKIFTKKDLIAAGAALIVAKCKYKVNLSATKVLYLVGHVVDVRGFGVKEGGGNPELGLPYFVDCATQCVVSTKTPSFDSVSLLLDYLANIKHYSLTKVGHVELPMAWRLGKSLGSVKGRVRAKSLEDAEKEGFNFGALINNGDGRSSGFGALRLSPEDSQKWVPVRHVNETVSIVELGRIFEGVQVFPRYYIDNPENPRQGVILVELVGRSGVGRFAKWQILPYACDAKKNCSRFTDSGDVFYKIFELANFNLGGAG
jgi:hypothetical protein